MIWHGKSKRRGLVRLPRIALLALAITACNAGGGPGADSETHPVSGKVLVGGQPAGGVEVRLHPLNRSGDPDAPSPHGTTDAEGRFELRTGEAREGAPAGQYTVTLAWPSGPGGADRLGGAFAEPDGSGLTAIVQDGPTELPPFEVGRVRPGGPP